MLWLALDTALALVALAVIALVTLRTIRRIKVLKAALDTAKQQAAPAMAALETLPRHEEPRRTT